MARCRSQLGVDGTCRMPCFLCAFPLFSFPRFSVPIISIAHVRILIIHSYMIWHSLHVNPSLYNRSGAWRQTQTPLSDIPPNSMFCARTTHISQISSIRHHKGNVSTSIPTPRASGRLDHEVARLVIVEEVLPYLAFPWKLANCT
jgi:hypothetical protein